MLRKKRVKRIADILEKLGVASLAIGLFQGKLVGLLVGIGSLILSLWLTREDV